MSDNLHIHLTAGTVGTDSDGYKLYETHYSGSPRLQIGSTTYTKQNMIDGITVAVLDTSTFIEVDTNAGGSCLTYEVDKYLPVITVINRENNKSETHTSYTINQIGVNNYSTTLTYYDQTSDNKLYYHIPGTYENTSTDIKIELNISAVDVTTPFMISVLGSDNTLQKQFVNRVTGVQTITFSGVHIHHDALVEINIGTTDVFALTLSNGDCSVLSDVTICTSSLSTNVTTNYNWTAVSSQAWAGVGPSSGTGNTNGVTITVEANGTASPRNANIAFKIDGTTYATFTVSQFGTDVTECP